MVTMKSSMTSSEINYLRFWKRCDNEIVIKLSKRPFGILKLADIFSYFPF